MRVSLKINIDKFFFSIILFLIYWKLFFSYLQVELSYFQRHFTPNIEKYNFLGLPKDFTAQVEILLIPLLVFFILKNYKFSGRLSFIFWLSTLMYGLNLITGAINSTSLLNSLNYSLKLFAPLYLFIVLIIHHKKTGFDLKKSALKVITFCLILTTVGFIFFDPSFNRGAFYLPVYFSGNHSHSYILVFCFIGISYLLYRRNQRKWMVFFLFTSFIFLLIGYNIRTALLCYLIFIFVMLYLSHDLFKLIIIKVAVFIFPISALLIFVNHSIDFDQISSGRLSMYAAKADQLMRNDVIDWLIGKGFGSDLIVIDTWWWGEKGAHSDLITYLVENGVVYLILFFVIVFSLLVLPGKLNVIYFSVVVGYFLSAIISNGIPSRPLPGYLFFMVLAYIYAEIKPEIKYTL